MSEARIRAKIEGLDEIKAQLLEIQAIMRQMGSDWTPFGGHGSGATGQPAATVMGGQVVATGGQPAPASAPLPGPAAQPGAKTGLTLSDFWAAIGGMTAIHQAGSAIGGAAGQYGQAMQAGQPWSPVAAAPAFLPLLGLGIGALLGGPVGAGAGAVVGGVAQQAIQPMANAMVGDKALNELSQILGYGPVRNYRGQAGLYDDLRAKEEAGIVSGMPLGSQWTSKFFNPELFRAFEHPAMRGAAKGFLSKYRWDIEGRMAMGLDPSMDKPNPLTDGDWERVLRRGASDDPLSARALAFATTRTDIARDIDQYSRRNDMTTLLTARSAHRIGMGELGLGMAETSGSRSEAASALKEFVEALRHSSTILRAEADDINRLNKGVVTEKERLKREEAERASGRATLIEVGKSKEQRLGSLESMGAHAFGMGLATFQRHELSGGSPFMMPWQALLSGKDREVSMISEQLNTPGLTESEREGLQVKLANARNQKLQLLGMRAQNAIDNFSTLATQGALVGIQQASGGGTFGSSFEQMTFGPASAISQIDAQIKSLQFAIGTTMDGRQREQMRNQLIALQTQRTQLGGAHAVAAIEGGLMPMAHSAGMGFMAASQGLASGVGGLAAGQLVQQRIGLMDEQIRIGESRVSSLLLAGFSQNSSEVMGAENQLAGYRLEREQMRGSGTLPWKAGMFSELTERKTLAGFQMAGYGGGGPGLRSNIQGQLKLLSGRLGELEEYRRMRQGAGSWNDAAEREYASERAGIASEALNLQLQYDQGWDQRLISQAYNLPSNVVTAQFNQRSAAFAGIRNRLFGGTSEQMEEFRGGGVARLLSMIGSDDPFGRGEFGMRQAERVKIELEVTVRDGNGSPLESSQRLLRDLPTGLNVQSDSAAKKNKSL